MNRGITIDFPFLEGTMDPVPEEYKGVLMARDFHLLPPLSEYNCRI